MAKAHLNPRMLGWAVERADAEVGDLATAFKKPPETIEAWLDGSDAPTFKQAQRLAKRLRVPFGYLFVEAPPEEDLPLVDFRRIHGAQQHRVSVDLRDVIADVLRRQDWYRDHLLDSDAEPVDCVGSFRMTDPASEVAEDMRLRLAFEAEVRPASQPAVFLRAFVRQVETLGILVMRSGIVGQATNRPLRVEEFRGFSIADPMAPVIFINSADSNAAQVFTLAHELAHIWIGEGGVSDADLTILGDPSSDIESFCSQVAGDLLLPWRALGESWMQRRGTLQTFVADTARQYHVSTVMVARQLWSHDAIDREQFFALYEAERSRWKAKAEGSSGGNYYAVAPIRNSRLLTETILESVRASETLIRDAAHLLGVKPANLPKLQESMGVA